VPSSAADRSGREQKPTNNPPQEENGRKEGRKPHPNAQSVADQHRDNARKRRTSHRKDQLSKFARDHALSALRPNDQLITRNLSRWLVDRRLLGRLLHLQGGDGEEPRQVTVIAAVLLAVGHQVIAARIKLLRNRMGG
jgi:hypothetical protein